MGRIRIALVVALAAAVVVGVQVAEGSSPPSKGLALKPGAATMRLLQGVNFVSSCGFSHRNQDDPIVYPGQPGKSHDHTFFGNESTDAFSTLTSLRAAETTCRRPGDTAAYWVPTLFASDGSPVEPLGATVYYRRRTAAPVRAFPAGLRMIAGDSRATAAQDLRVTFWNCGVEGGVKASSEIPTCPGTGRQVLRLHVTFPSCWNGKTLDSADHQSHMAYPRNGLCPPGYPVAVPAVSVIVRYPVAGGPGYELASGGSFTGHADFFNAWNQRALARLVEECLDHLRHCGGGI